MFLGQNTRLQVGSPLPTLPAELPLPDRAEFQWGVIGDQGTYTLIFEIPASSSQVESAYVAQLQAAGWQPFAERDRNLRDSSDMIVERIVTEEDDTSSYPPVFCQNSTHAELSLDFLTPDASTARLRLDIETAPSRSRCRSSQDIAEGSFVDVLGKLGLSFPQNAETNFLSVAKDENYEEEQYELKTNLTLSELSDYYLQQMSQDWTLQNRGGDDLVQWLTWSRTTSAGISERASFNFFAKESAGQIFVSFRIEQIEPLRMLVYRV